MSGRVQQDAIFSSTDLRNRIKIQWLASIGNSLPVGCLRVNGDNVISLYNDRRNSWVLKSFKISGNVLPDSVQFLVADESDVTWKPMSANDQLPRRAIRCPKAGQYGSMYIGRFEQLGVGMVVSIDDETYVFLNAEGQQIERNFDVLCSR